MLQETRLLIQMLLESYDGEEHIPLGKNLWLSSERGKIFLNGDTASWEYPDPLNSEYKDDPKYYERRIKEHKVEIPFPIAMALLDNILKLKYKITVLKEDDDD